jgi:sigma-B regulation protein RsbU (phosphoserine phosphatase)
VFIADVMGHGTRSALITSMIRSLISELYPQGRNAAHFLKELNKNFCDMLKNLPNPVFASAAFFVADTTSRVATYSLAGHPPPFHLHRSVGRVTRMERTKPRGGALGLVPEEEFGGETVRLTDGDVFVFFTDGAYEAANKDGEEFGMARFEKALHSHIYEDPSVLLKKVLQDIRRFAGEEPVADDICLVCRPRHLGGAEEEVSSG